MPLASQELRVDAGLGEAGHRVDLVDQDLAVGLDEEVAAGKAGAAGEGEDLGSELADAGHRSAEIGAGTRSSMPPSVYFASKSYHSALARISPGREASGSSLPSTEHSTSRPGAEASMITRGSWRTPARPRRRGPPGRSTLVMPTLEPSREGLTQSGSPSASQRPRQSVPPDGDELDLGHPVCGEEPLQRQLVHADRRGEDVGADVGESSHSSRPWSAVLAEGAVQGREDRVGPEQAGGRNQLDRAAA